MGSRKHKSGKIGIKDGGHHIYVPEGEYIVVMRAGGKKDSHGFFICNDKGLYVSCNWLPDKMKKSSTGTNLYPEYVLKENGNED